MNISQAAAQTGLSAKQIRDYEKQGLLPPAPRSEAGYRRFLPVDLQRLRFIAHAREVGFSLAQIKRLLALADDPERHSRDVKQLTSEHIAELNQKIATLQTMRDTLQAWHNQCAGDDAAACCILEGIGSLKPHPPNKKPFMHQAQRVLSLSNRRYINAPIICTSKILNTVIDGKIIA